MKKLIKKILRKKGLQIKRFPDIDFKRRILLMNKMNIQTVIDVGANTGQYAKNLRDFGYKANIISFEPLKSTFHTLLKNSRSDRLWSAKNFALGNVNHMSKINVSKNSYSSSILDMLPSHCESAPDSVYIDKEEIEIKTLDSIFDSICEKSDNVMIKIDAQGFEKNILEGAEETLKIVKLLQLEMSIIPLYKDEMIFAEMLNFLDKKGFQLVSLENGFNDKTTGQLLQVDGIFTQKALLIENKLH